MDTTRGPSFGTMLRRYRRAANLTQEELAEQAGISVRAISDIERGLRHPRRDTSEMLLDALRVAPDDRALFSASARGNPSAWLGWQTEISKRQGSFLGALPLGPLIGRRRELHRIMEFFDSSSVRGECETWSRANRVILLMGEPGVGKTRLAQEIALGASERGYLVATGRCYESVQHVPFFPFLETLATVYEAAPPELQTEIPRRWPYLTRLIPDHVMGSSVLPVGTAADAPEEQQRLFRAVSGVLQMVTEELPVTLLLDDLHWADEASLQLILHLSRYLYGHRIMLFATYRDIGINHKHPLAHVLVALNRERLLERIIIRQLDDEDTGALIRATIGGGDVPGELARLVHRHTDGNPFFIQEVVRALIERGELFQAGDQWLARNLEEIEVPDSVHSIIGERLSRLPSESQSALFEASVFGDTFSFDELREVHQSDETEVERALEAATAAGLVRETGVDSYAFDHALTRQALYEELPARRRRRLHHAAGEALERSLRIRGGDSSEKSGAHMPAGRWRTPEIAQHFIMSGDAYRALPYILSAGDHALQVFAFEEAERYYRTALELTAGIQPNTEEVVPSPGTIITEQAEALAKLGRVLDTEERYDEALDVLEQAANIYHNLHDLGQEGRIVAEIGWAHRGQGTAEKGIDRIQPLIDAMEHGALPRSHISILAGLYTALARLLFKLGKYDEELTAAERATELARMAGDPAVLAVAEARRGTALMTLGRREEAIDVLETAADLAGQTGNLGTMSVALDNLGELFRDAGNLQRSRAYLARALDVSQQMGLSTRIAWTLTRLGRIAFLLGDWDVAETHLSHAVELLRSVDLEWQAASPLVHLLNIQMLKGEGEEPRNRLEAIVMAAHPERDEWIIRHVERFLAEIDLLEGRPFDALDRLQPLVDLEALDHPQALQLLLVLAHAHLETGNTSMADDLLARCVERARAQHEQLFLVDMLQVQGMFLARKRQWNEARVLFDEMETIAREMSFPYGEARALYQSGMMYLWQGKIALAREKLQKALAEFRSLGAQVYANRTRQALAQA